MIDKKIIEEYLPTIGIECHVQLKTKSKLFSYADNNAREADPNTMVTPICFGLPGTLPVLNQEAINIAIKAGKALSAKVAAFSAFDRKHYFYPDLPKGYQITQLAHPIVSEGKVKVPLSTSKSFDVGIERAHLEEDAGKSTHEKGAMTQVDLNRAGTPLLEIVSRPDMHSAEEAKAYAQELYFLMKYAEVSDADLYHGNMRFDVNISVAKKADSKLGTRAEIKNLNSFRSIEKAVTYEIARQVEILEKGESVVQETRGWDDAKMKTFSQRTKEEAHDYRYFPEPDLPPVELKQEYIDEVQSTVELVPILVREKLSPFNLELEQINTILENQSFIDVVMDAIGRNDEKLTRRVINWLLVDIQALIIKDLQTDVPTAKQLEGLHSLVESGQLSSTAAKEVLVELTKDKDADAETTAKQRNLLQENDESAIRSLVDEVIAENPQAVEDLKNGEMKVMGFLVGQAMKKSQGKANPGMVNKYIKESLGL